MTVPQSTCCGNKLTNFSAPMVNFKSDKPAQVEKPKTEIPQVKAQKASPIEIKVSPKLKYEPRLSINSTESANSAKKAEKIEIQESAKISKANKYTSKNSSHSSVHKETNMKPLCSENLQKELISAYVKSYVKSYLADFKRIQQTHQRSRSTPRQPNTCHNVYNTPQKMYYNLPNQYNNNCRNYVLFAT